MSPGYTVYTHAHVLAHIALYVHIHEYHTYTPVYEVECHWIAMYSVNIWLVHASDNTVHSRIFCLGRRMACTDWCGL